MDFAKFLIIPFLLHLRTHPTGSLINRIIVSTQGPNFVRSTTEMNIEHSPMTTHQHDKLIEAAGADDGHGYSDPAETCQPSASHSQRPTFKWNESRRIRKYFHGLRGHRAHMMGKLSFSPPPRPTGLDKRLSQLEIRLAISAVMDSLANENIYHARKEARRALHLAYHLDDKTILARCFYWMGRIESQQRNMVAADAHFRATQLCVLDRECPESVDLAFRLDFCRFHVEGQTAQASIVHSSF